MMFDERWRGSEGSEALKRSQQYGQSYSALTQGGYQNYSTGAGTGIDKGEGGFFVPTRWYSRHIGEVIRVQSGAALKYIELAINEMFERWREWDKDENEQGAEAMKEAERRHMVPMIVANAIKTGRQQGTSLLVMVTRENDGDLTMPLIPERVRAGDLVELRIYDRHTAAVWQYQDDPMMPHVQQACRVLHHAVPRRRLLRPPVARHPLRGHRVATVRRLQHL